MNRFVVTIEWVLLFGLGTLLMGGLIMSLFSDDASRPKWIATAYFLTMVAGLAFILWQGAAGHLPGTGVSATSTLAFVARFLAWSGSLAILTGVVFAVAGYLLVRGDNVTADFTTGMTLLPGVAGVMLGFLAGAVIAVIRAFR